MRSEFRKLWDNRAPPRTGDSGQICGTVPQNVGRLATMYVHDILDVNHVHDVLDVQDVYTVIPVNTTTV